MIRLCFAEPGRRGEPPIKRQLKQNTWYEELRYAPFKTFASLCVPTCFYDARSTNLAGIKQVQTTPSLKHVSVMHVVPINGKHTASKERQVVLGQPGIEKKVPAVNR